jgi:hypothetical protein
VANYPSGLDSLSNPTGATNQNDAGFLHSVQHGTANDIIEQLEAKLGISDTSPQNTPQPNSALISTATGSSKWAAVSSLAFDWSSVPSAFAYSTVNLSIPSSTPTALAFNAERYDTEIIHNNTAGLNAQLTCRTAGKYRITANICFAGGAGAVRQVQIIHNVAGVIAEDDRPPSTAGNLTTVSISTVWTMAVGESVNVSVYQDSGGALNVRADVGPFSPCFMMERIG